MSKQQQIKGRMPVSQKLDQGFDMAEIIESSDRYKLDPALRKELESQGLEWRFINRKQYLEEAGFHKAGWKVYRRKETEKKGSLDFTQGVDAEGYVRVGDLVLAVKTTEEQNKYRNYVAYRNQQQAGTQKKNVEEMRRLIGSRDGMGVVEDEDEE